MASIIEKRGFEPEFGKSRLFRSDVSRLERLYFRLIGLADPAHFVRSEYFKRFVHGMDPHDILDVGCGSGDYSFYIAERFPSARVFAIDGDASIIERNRRTADRMNMGNLEFAIRDMRAIDDRAAYDLIICVETLQYVDQPEVVIEKLARALKTNGYLYIHMPLRRYRQVPFHRFLRDFHDDEVVATTTKDEITGMITSVDLTIEKCQYTFAYYAGEMACSLFCMFYKNTSMNRLMQGLVSPWARMLGWLELQACWSKGFALAVLAKKLK